MKNEKLEIRVLSSLEKVFADEELKAAEWPRASMLSNEVYSFQVAYKWDDRMLKKVGVGLASELLPFMTVRKVELIPSEMPCYKDYDDNVLRTAPGLYPDLLAEIGAEGLTLLPEQWRSIWITVNPVCHIEPGTYPIEISFNAQSGEELGKATFKLEIIPAKLPKQSLIHTQWFHTDCLSTWYGVEVFSEEYWMRVEQYITTAVNNGINMILTPLFTPPLDTAVGEERPTVQLVDVEKTGDIYKFNFHKLKRWTDLCLSIGVEYFEFSHLFTQWGARYAPKIIAMENGRTKRIFGWDTEASGEEYKKFLSQFLPELTSFIKQNCLESRSYFHVSDEPLASQIEAYKCASNIIQQYLKEFPVIDALSDYKFYELGIVKNPIPPVNHIDPFIENKVKNLWTYYCCSQYRNVSNRFFNMPSARNRIIGMQMYKFDIKGFLHWGYNFWNSEVSRYPIDPFRVTDGVHTYPSGDAFVVYPGEKGPIESLRLKVFYEAIQDLRALKLLEELIGKKAVLELLEEGLEKPITFSEYPKDSEWLLMKREQINKRILEVCKK